MSDAPSSIQSAAFVLDHYCDLPLAEVAEVQSYALSHKLPFSVVCCLDPSAVGDEAFIVLERTEKLLGKYHIPLIVLIGGRESALAVFARHAKPRIFSASDVTAQAGQLRAHVPDWPGTVQRVSRIREYIRTTPDMCIL
jgi:hypothetical protein